MKKTAQHRTSNGWSRVALGGAIGVALASVSCGGTDGPSADGVLLEKVGSTQQAMVAAPADVWAARGDTWNRVQHLANAYVRHWADTSRAFQSWTDGKNGLRTVGALIQLYKSGAVAPDVDARLGGWDAVRPQVEAFMNTIYGHHDVGTDPADNPRKDYDMALKELATLLYSNIYSPQFLTNQMIFKMICQDNASVMDEGGCVDNSSAANPLANPSGVASYSGQYLRKKAYVGYGKTFSETENHVLMIHSWKYLINNYVKWVAGLPSDHYRYDARIKYLYDTNPAQYNNTAELEDFVLQLLGRPLHNGMFEENSKAYESLSLHAIMNLYLGANVLTQSDGQAKVKLAAQNAIDYLAAKFTFQSFEGKRIPGMRRNWGYKERRGFYNNDYLPEMMAIMSGLYAFDPNARYDSFRINGAEIAEGQGYALWTGLFWMNSPYYLPVPIHDYMLNKHSGYYARMQTFYTKDHYGEDRDPIYFQNGAAYKPASTYTVRVQTGTDRRGVPIYANATRGVFSSSPEFYFATPTYLNSSGGYYRPYYDVGLPAAFSADASVGYHAYDFVSKPTTLVPRGDIGQNWGTEGSDYTLMSSEVLSMKGDWQNPGQSANTWVYKNFAYGFIWEKDVSSNYHTYWPQKYPAEWDAYATAPQTVGRARFKVFDLRNVPASKSDLSGPKLGFYVVMGQFSKSSSDKDFWNYARGMWEIVPGGFNSKEALLSAVIANNNHADWYNDSTSGHYYYKTAMSGETLKLDNKVGATASYQSIMEIKDRYGNVQDLNAVFVRINNAYEVRSNLPLLDVKEVNGSYDFTGVTLASAPGDGRMTVYNPYMGYTLRIDSSDYKNPTRPQEY